MKIYPAVDIKDGKCVRLRKGVASDSTVYFENPADAAKAFADAGSKVIHVVDLDGAFAEVLRALKPGGTFLIANHQADPERAEWTDVVDNMTVRGEEEITARLSRAGFAEIAAHRRGWLCVIAKKPELRG